MLFLHPVGVGRVKFERFAYVFFGPNNIVMCRSNGLPFCKSFPISHQNENILDNASKNNVGNGPDCRSIDYDISAARFY